MIKPSGQAPLEKHSARQLISRLRNRLFAQTINDRLHRTVS